MHARWLLGPLLLHTSPDGSLNLTVSLVGTIVTKGVALKIHHRTFVVYSRFLGDAETRSSLRARTDRYLQNVPMNAAMNGFSYVENKHGKTVDDERVEARKVEAGCWRENVNEFRNRL